MKTRKLFSREYADHRHLMNPDWEFVPSSQTDISVTHARERERLRMLSVLASAPAPVNITAVNVLRLARVKKDG